MMRADPAKGWGIYLTLPEGIDPVGDYIASLALGDVEDKLAVERQGVIDRRNREPYWPPLSPALQRAADRLARNRLGD